MSCPAQRHRAPTALWQSALELLYPWTCSISVESPSTSQSDWPSCCEATLLKVCCISRNYVDVQRCKTQNQHHCWMGAGLPASSDLAGAPIPQWNWTLRDPGRTATKEADGKTNCLPASLSCSQLQGSKQLQGQDPELQSHSEFPKPSITSLHQPMQVCCEATVIPPSWNN